MVREIFFCGLAVKEAKPEKGYTGLREEIVVDSDACQLIFKIVFVEGSQPYEFEMEPHLLS